MREFLGPEWLQDLGEAVGDSVELVRLAASGRLVVEQVVTGAGPSPEPVRYHLVLEPGPPARALLVTGPAEAPDLVLTTDLATAVGIGRGDLNAQEALAAGRYRIRGRLDRLVALRPALAAVGDLFSAVRARTAFPPTCPATRPLLRSGPTTGKRVASGETGFQ